MKKPSIYQLDPKQLEKIVVPKELKELARITNTNYYLHGGAVLALLFKLVHPEKKELRVKDCDWAIPVSSEALDGLIKLSKIKNLSKISQNYPLYMLMDEKGNCICEVSSIYLEGKNEEEMIYASAIQRDTPLKGLFCNVDIGKVYDFVGGYEDIYNLKYRPIKITEKNEKSIYNLMQVFRFFDMFAEFSNNLIELDYSTFNEKIKWGFNYFKTIEKPSKELFKQLYKSFSNGYAQKIIEVFANLSYAEEIFLCYWDCQKNITHSASLIDDHIIQKNKTLTPAQIFSLLLRPSYNRQCTLNYMALNKAANLEQITLKSYDLERIAYQVIEKTKIEFDIYTKKKIVEYLTKSIFDLKELLNFMDKENEKILEESVIEIGPSSKVVPLVNEALFIDEVKKVEKLESVLVKNRKPDKEVEIKESCNSSKEEILISQDLSNEKSIPMVCEHKKNKNKKSKKINKENKKAKSFLNDSSKNNFLLNHNDLTNNSLEEKKESNVSKVNHTRSSSFIYSFFPSFYSPSNFSKKPRRIGKTVLNKIKKNQGQARISSAALVEGKEIFVRNKYLRKHLKKLEEQIIAKIDICIRLVEEERKKRFQNRDYFTQMAREDNPINPLYEGWSSYFRPRYTEVSGKYGLSVVLFLMLYFLIFDRVNFSKETLFDVSFYGAALACIIFLSLSMSDNYAAETQNKLDNAYLGQMKKIKRNIETMDHPYSEKELKKIEDILSEPINKRGMGDTGFMVKENNLLRL